MRFYMWSAQMPCRIAGFKRAGACQPRTRTIVTLAASIAFYFTVYSHATDCSTAFRIMTLETKNTDSSTLFEGDVGRGWEETTAAMCFFLLSPEFKDLTLWAGVLHFQLRPDFHDTGLETSKPSSGNRCPESTPLASGASSSGGQGSGGVFLQWKIRRMNSSWITSVKSQSRSGSPLFQIAGKQDRWSDHQRWKCGC